MEFFFLPIASASDDNSLSSNQDINQFLVYVDVDVTQLEHSNNKCYASIFRYIYIHIYIYIYLYINIGSICLIWFILLFLLSYESHDSIVACSWHFISSFIWLFFFWCISWLKRNILKKILPQVESFLKLLRYILLLVKFYLSKQNFDFQFILGLKQKSKLKL